MVSYEKGVFQIDTHFLDIDECSAKTHGCDANAVCHNTEGSFICKCKAGYVRNGQNCVGKLLLVGYQSAGSVWKYFAWK